MNCKFVYTLCSSIILVLIVSGSLITFIILSTIHCPWAMIPVLLFITIFFVDLITCCFRKRCSRFQRNSGEVAHDHSNVFTISVMSGSNQITNNHSNLNQNHLNQISAPTELPPSYEMVTIKLPSYEEVVKN